MENTDITRNNYKHARNEVVSKNFQSLLDYETKQLNILNSKVTDSKSFWQTLKSKYNTKVKVSPYQSGFHPGDSTVKQLVSICHNISQALDNGDEIMSVFLDFKKAFDKV